MAAPETWRAPPVVVRSQIVENCSFFSPPGAQLSVILTREPLGTYKAIVLRAELGSQREVVLSSESADTLNKAFELLLIKSADAVQNYITTNGFEFAPSTKKVADIVDVDEDEDDGVSSVSSSVVVDDDPVKNLEDSTLSLSEVESAYESVSEDGIDVRYSRARAPHTSTRGNNSNNSNNTTTTTTTTHAFPMRVRRSRSPRSPDNPGRQQRASPPPAAPPHYTPHHNFPVHRRRPTSPVRVNLNPNAGNVVDGPMGSGRQVAPPPTVGVGPPAPSLRTIGGVGGGAWQYSPVNAAPPPVMHANNNSINSINSIRADPAGPPRSRPSQYFSLHPPPPPGMTLGPVQPPPRGFMQQQHPPIGINREATNGPSPTGAIMHPMSAVFTGHPGTTAAAASPPPPPSSSSTSSLASSTSSTPTLAASPNKPPTPSSTPAAIDCRLCIRSRGPDDEGATDNINNNTTTTATTTQAGQKWHEQRFILRAPPTRAHIRGAALRLIELNPDRFRHLGAKGNSAPPCRPLDGFGAWVLGGGGGGGGDGRQHQHQHQHQHQQQLRAALTRAVFGDGEGYDLSTYAEDDLSRLCASMCGGGGGAAGQGAMPLFEVTVQNVGPAGSFFTLS